MYACYASLTCESKSFQSSSAAQSPSPSHSGKLTIASWASIIKTHSAKL